MAATSVAEIGLDLVVNQKQFNKQMSGITSLAKKAGATLAAAFTVKKIVDFGKQCMELGSDLQEVQNVVDVTFPGMSKRVDQFAQSAAASFGLSETMAKQYTGTFGAMAKAFGFTEKQAYDMGITLTALAGDVASFYNLSQDEAYTKLKSVFTGETESLKDLGVVMTQSALDAYALANGFGKTTQAMSEAEKVALRYQFVQSKLAAAQGDFIRTSDSWANQCRILSLQTESFMATIGQGLINLLTPVIKIINTVMGKLMTLANAFKSFTALITGKQSSGTGSVSQLGNVADSAAEGMTSAAGAANGLSGATKDVGKAAKKAAQEMRALMGFDKVQKLSEPSDSGSGSDTGSSGAGAGGAPNPGAAINFGSLAQGETVIDEVDSKFTKLFSNIQKSCEPAIASLKRLWNEGFARIGNFTWGALKDFYNGFLVPVGTWTIGKGFPRFVDILNNGLAKVDFNKIQSALQNLWKTLAPFAKRIGEGLLWFWENVLVPLGTWKANEIVPRFIDTIRISIEAFNKILDALKPLFEWFWNNVLQPLAKWAGGVFLKTWDGINAALKSFSDWCEKHPGAIQNITTIIGSFFAAFKVVKLAKEIGGLINKVGSLFGTFTALSRAMGLGQAATTLLGKAFSALTSPAGIAVLAIGAVVAAGVLIWKNWDTIKEKAKEIWDKISDFLSRTWENIKNSCEKIWNSIKKFLGKLWDGLKDTASKIFGKLKDALSTVWNGIKTAASKAWNGIKSLLSSAWNKIKDLASKAFDGIKNTVSSAWKGVKSLTSSAWNGIKSTLSSAWNGIKNTASKAFNGIKSTVSSAWQGTKTLTSSAWNGIKSTLTGSWSSIKSKASSVFSGIKSTVSSAWNGLKSATSSAWGGVADTISSVFGNVSSAASSMGSNIRGAFSSAFNGVVSLIRTPVNTIIRFVNGLIKGVTNGINAILRAFNSLRINIPSWVPVFGGKRLGFHFSMRTAPQIPYLAEGGFVKKNTPQLAMIGDNRHQGEVVAPEDKLLEMAMAAAKAAAGSADSSAVLALLREILAYLKNTKLVAIDPEALRKYFIEKTNQRTDVTGVCELKF